MGYSVFRDHKLTLQDCSVSWKANERWRKKLKEKESEAKGSKKAQHPSDVILNFSGLFGFIFSKKELKF